MELLKKPKEIEMPLGQFERIAENLRRRGFAEKVSDSSHFRVGGTVSSLSKDFTDFELVIKANTARVDMAMLQAGLRNSSDFEIISVCVSYRTRSGKNLDILPVAFEKKAHHMENVGGVNGSLYVASLQPSEDIGLMISNSLNLNAKIAQIKADNELGNAIDSKEIFDKLTGFLKSFNQANRYLASINNYFGNLLTGCKTKFDYEMARIKNDRSVIEAMALVLDK